MSASLSIRLLAPLAVILAATGCSQLGPAVDPPLAVLAPESAKTKSLAEWGTARPNEMERAKELERAGQLSEAERLYQAIVRKNPRHPAAYHRLGVLAAIQGRYDDAQLEFETALDLAPATTELLNDIAHTHALQDHPGEAERYYRRALILGPEDMLVCRNFGVLLATQGRYEESLAVFRRAIPEADAYAQIAYARGLGGDTAAAQQWAQRAIELQPNFQAALQEWIPNAGGLLKEAPEIELAGYEEIEPQWLAHQSNDVNHAYHTHDVKAINPTSSTTARLAIP